MWLFQFRIGGEKQSGSKTKTEGLGHALRCLAIMDVAKNKYGIESKAIINKNPQSEAFLNSLNVDFFWEEDVATVLQPRDLLLIDINYYPPEKIQKYQEKCPVVCLAPRGEAKYWADISFKDSFFADILKPNASPENRIYAGPSYAVMGDKFRVSRKLFERGQLQKERKNIVISMGGVDHFDMTGAVIKGLVGLPEDYYINIIVGPLYSCLNQLRESLNQLVCFWKIYQNPEDISQIIGMSEFGIFGSGMVAYEGVGLGVPCINLGHSTFHFQRGKELEDLGVGFCGGDYQKISRGQLVDKVVEVIEDHQYLNFLQNKCCALVDGDGIYRILDLILKK